MCDVSGTRSISFTLNGEPVTAEVKPYHNLVDVLQGEFNLTGARESCGQGLCGCCTVIVDGTAVSGCLYLAAFVDGAEVTTVEHLDASGTLDPVQEAFIESGAFQCGYCTPGFVLMARQLLDGIPIPTTIRSGTICQETCVAAPPIRKSSRRSRTVPASVNPAPQARETKQRSCFRRAAFALGRARM
jgi:aerobic carbon-monoxide dehydrogenase small subunit